MGIETVGDAAVEMVLKSECGSVGKVVHLLRAAGDELAPDDLCKWDAEMRRSLGRSLNGELEDAAWMQAMGGFARGGLGWRSAADQALPAFWASRVAARPAVQLLFDSLVGAGFGGPQQFLEQYDMRTRAAAAVLRGRLPTAEAQQLEDVMRDGKEEAAKRWQTFVDECMGDTGENISPACGYAYDDGEFDHAARGGACGRKSDSSAEGGGDPGWRSPTASARRSGG